MTESGSVLRTAGSSYARGFWVTPSATGEKLGRAYFGLQACAGSLWWISVFLLPGVAQATLGRINPVLMAIGDIPLFVVASALLAFGVRRAVWIVVPWTWLVTAGLVIYATVSGEAGWGALIMVAASVGGALAWLLTAHGCVPATRMLRGPFAFGRAQPRTPGQQLGRTLLQMLGFWVVFLGVVPAAIYAVEMRWGVGIDGGSEHLHAWSGAAGAVVLVLASCLGLWSAFAMSLVGDGTPLPSAAANRLVIVGPYRFVRNPMAVAGISQAIGVGMVTGSWLVVAYALCGAVYWNELVRPLEEADLSARFGAEYLDYRKRVRCWAPRLLSRSDTAASASAASTSGEASA